MQRCGIISNKRLPLYLSGEPFFVCNVLSEDINGRSASKFDALLLCSDSAGIQTRNLLIRSQMLYSVELRSRALFISELRVQRYNFSVIPPNDCETFLRKTAFCGLI